MRLCWATNLAAIVLFGCTADTGEKDNADILIRNVRVVSAHDANPQTPAMRHRNGRVDEQFWNSIAELRQGVSSDQ